MNSRNLPNSYTNDIKGMSIEELDNLIREREKNVFNHNIDYADNINKKGILENEDKYISNDINENNILNILNSPANHIQSNKNRNKFREIYPKNNKTYYLSSKNEIKNFTRSWINKVTYDLDCNNQSPSLKSPNESMVIKLNQSIKELQSTQKNSQIQSPKQMRTNPINDIIDKLGKKITMLTDRNIELENELEFYKNCYFKQNSGEQFIQQDKMLKELRRNQEMVIKEYQNKLEALTHENEQLKIYIEKNIQSQISDKIEENNQNDYQNDKIDLLENYNESLIVNFNNLKQEYMELLENKKYSPKIDSDTKETKDGKSSESLSVDNDNEDEERGKKNYKNEDLERIRKRYSHKTEKPDSKIAKKFSDNTNRYTPSNSKDKPEKDKSNKSNLSTINKPIDKTPKDKGKDDKKSINKSISTYNINNKNTSQKSNKNNNTINTNSKRDKKDLIPKDYKRNQKKLYKHNSTGNIESNININSILKKSNTKTPVNQNSSRQKPNKKTESSTKRTDKKQDNLKDLNISDNSDNSDNFNKPNEGKIDNYNNKNNNPNKNTINHQIKFNNLENSEIKDKLNKIENEISHYQNDINELNEKINELKNENGDETKHIKSILKNIEILIHIKSEKIINLRKMQKSLLNKISESI